MPTTAIVRCIVCDRLAELPHWRRSVAGQTSGGEVFSVDVPLCLECEEWTRPTLPWPLAGLERTDKRAYPMPDFQVGDRVRVRNLPTTVACAGRVGAVVWASRTPAGSAYAYHVRLDGSLPGIFGEGEIRATFSPHDLKPETGGDSP